MCDALRSLAGRRDGCARGAGRARPVGVQAARHGEEKDHTGRTERRSRAVRVSVLLGVALTLAAVLWRWRFVAAAGGLWRDEANTLNVACEPTWEAFRTAARYDSFALLWQFLMRAWAWLAGCEGDFAWRWLGFALGVAQLAALWVAARPLGIAAPLCSLLLYGWNPAAITYGSSVRGYGLGAALVCLSLAATLRFAATGSRGAWGAAALASLAAVQTYLPNGVLLAAAEGVVGLSLALARQGRRALALAACTLLMTLSLVGNADWIAYALAVGGIEQRDVAWQSVWRGWLETATTGMPAQAALWVAALVLLAASPLSPGAQAWFMGALPLALAAAAFLCYSLYVHSVAKLGGLPWYYLAALAMLALCADLALTRIATAKPAAGKAASAVAVLVALLLLPGTWRAAHLRMTNVDQLATLVGQQADAGDLVLVTPWYAGISFQRYYRGAAAWQTVPPLPDHRYHLHLEIRARMQQGDAAIAPLLERVESTLRAGGTVWLVGVPKLPPEGEPAPSLPPAGEGRASAGPYLDAWEQRIALFLFEHAAQAQALRVAQAVPVSSHEQLSSMRLRGWRD